jgi:iron complex outermembrane recepter protein
MTDDQPSLPGRGRPAPERRRRTPVSARPFVPGVRAALAVLCASALAARAQADPDTLRVVEQDTVQVRAARLVVPLRELATSATLVTRADLRHAGARTLAAVMAGVPGVHVFDLSGSDTQSQVETRGFASLGFTSHVRVLVDEMPVNDLEGARVDWNLLAPPQVERIELLRGPASYLYGDVAMAGVIDIVTRDAPGGVRAWVGGGTGSESERIGHGGVSWRDGRRSASGSFSYHDTDGWREHSAATLASGYGTAAMGLGRWSARGQLLLHREDQEVPGALPDPLWRTDPGSAQVPVLGGTSPDFRRTHAAAGAVSLHGPVGRGAVTAMVFADARDLTARETVVPADTLDHLSNAHRQRGELRGQWGTPEHIQWVWGVDGEHGRLLTAYYPPIAGSRGTVGEAVVSQQAIGAYGLGRRTLRERLSLTAALRGDWSRSRAAGAADRTLRALSPAAALNYATAGGGNAFLSAGGAFKTPTLEQLHDPRPYFNPQLGAAAPISSTALSPQRGWNVDFGLRALPSTRARGEATLYYGRSRDEIGFDLADFRYSNIARSIHYGLEGRIGAPLGRGLGAQASYAYTRAVFDGGPNDGKQINDVPIHLVTLDLTVAHALHGEVALTERYVDRQWIDEANLREVPAYGVADLTVLQHLGPVALSLAVRNAFDRRYATSGYVTSDLTGAPLPLLYPGGGRTVRAGLQWSPRE